MNDDDSLRVARLLAWIKRHKSESLCTSDGRVSPSALAVATGKKPSYWSDVLRAGSGKSFGEKSARDTESKLEMPPMYLDGTGWPFESVDQDRWERLSERQKGRVEDAMLKAIEMIESENRDRANGTTG